MKTGLEIKVIERVDKSRFVAIHFLAIDQTVVMDADSTKHLAFLLMQCADYIDPPFSDANPESESIFGPYDLRTEEDEDEEDENLGAST